MYQRYFPQNFVLSIIAVTLAALSLLLGMILNVTVSTKVRILKPTETEINVRENEPEFDSTPSSMDITEVEAEALSQSESIEEQ